VSSILQSQDETCAAAGEKKREYPKKVYGGLTGFQIAMVFEHHPIETLTRRSTVEKRESHRFCDFNLRVSETRDGRFAREIEHATRARNGSTQRSGGQ